MGDWPFLASTPITWNGIDLMRTVWPIGSDPGPYRRSTTVCPSSTTLVEESTSDAVKLLPEATGQLRISKYSGGTPDTEVVQFCSSLTIWAVLRRYAAAWRTEGTSVWIAFRSSQVKVGID